MRKRASSSLVLVLLALAALPSLAAAAPRNAPSLKRIEAVVELRHPRGLAQFVRAVSDPASPRYRQYATVAQLTARFGAREKEQKQVLGFFRRHGARATLLSTGNFVFARLDPRTAARLLPASGAGASAAGLAGVRAVPAALRGAVSRVEITPATAHVVPSTAEASDPASAAAKLSAAQKQPRKPFTSAYEHTGTSAGCAFGREAGLAEIGYGFTPNQYLKAYGHAALHAKGLEGQGETVAVVETDGYRPSDVRTFAKCFGVKPPTLETIPVLPEKEPVPPGDETTLDLEMLSVGAPKLDRIRVYEGSEATEALPLTMAAALGRPGAEPDVISISLGICEPEFTQAVALPEAMDNVLEVAAGAGISVLVSAGDQGSSGCRAGPPGEEVTELPVLAASVPASLPFATSVGGTNLKLSKSNQIKEELPWNDAVVQPSGTGGGGSLLTARTPWYQRNLHRYGSSGRVSPDISALADIYPGYAFFCSVKACEEPERRNGGWRSVGGTSAAAPLTAAGVALADQYAEQLGQPRLGFLNPLLYSLGSRAKTRAAVFTDVTKGNNDLGRALLPEVGGGRPLGCCSARPGYDWASGWGSLKLARFAQAAANLAPRPAAPTTKK